MINDDQECLDIKELMHLLYLEARKAFRRAELRPKCRPFPRYMTDMRVIVIEICEVRCKSKDIIEHIYGHPSVCGYFTCSDINYSSPGSLTAVNPRFFTYFYPTNWRYQ
jgi:hypothetical protein